MTEDLVAGTLSAEQGADEFGEILRRKKATLFFKRFFDIFASFFGLIVLFVPFLCIALAIKLTSRGPVFSARCAWERTGRSSAFSNSARWFRTRRKRDFRSRWGRTAA